MFLCGKYVNDLALRFDYSQVLQGKLTIQPDIAAAAEELKNEGDLPLYVVTCFSDRDKLLNLTQRD